MKKALIFCLVVSAVVLLASAATAQSIVTVKTYPSVVVQKTVVPRVVYSAPAVAVAAVPDVTVVQARPAYQVAVAPAAPIAVSGFFRDRIVFPRRPALSVLALP